MEEKPKEKYDPNDFDKATYSINNTELAVLTPWDTQVQVGMVAQKVIESILRTVVLKRLGIRNSQDIGLEYNTQTSQLYVWQPKKWCSMCKNRKAEYSYKEQVFCGDCVEILRAQAKSQQEEKPKEPEKKTTKKK